MPAERRAANGGFVDLFSTHAQCYSRSRPGYPTALFAYLAGLVPRRWLAWDCGTGNGQAAVGLASHFEHVIATDASEAQIAHATPHGRIEYRVALAEEAELEPGSVDLVTVAQALHWLPLDAFYANVRRVARPGGVIAAWCYSLSHVSPPVDAVLHRFYHDVTGPFWGSGRRWIDERYETIPFPFDEIRPASDSSVSQSRDQHPSRERRRAVATGANAPPDAPGTGDDLARLECREEWTLPEYLDYLSSWSAVQRFKEQKGYDPLEEISDDLAAAWGDPAQRRVATWPIHLRAGRVV